MSNKSAPLSSKITVDILKEFDLTDCCRICKCRPENGIKMRPLFNGHRLTRIIANTIHIEIKDLPGLPRFICEKCLSHLKAFSNFQVDFRRSEEGFRMALEARKHLHMDSLIAFSNSIEMEKQQENDHETAIVTNIIKNNKKNTGKSKSNIDKFNK